METQQDPSYSDSLSKAGVMDRAGAGSASTFDMFQVFLHFFRLNYPMRKNNHLRVWEREGSQETESHRVYPIGHMTLDKSLPLWEPWYSFLSSVTRRK